MNKAILIVGQGPSKSGVGKKPLEGKRGSGAALAKMAGVAIERIFELADVVNLLDDWHGKNGKGDKFPAELARKRAEDIQLKWQYYNWVVLLGSNVSKAFGFVSDPLIWHKTDSTYVAILPHPSGLNRWYNERANVDSAMAFLSELFAPKIIEGEVAGRKHRAEYCTEKLKEYDARFDWVELALIIVECERDRLFLEVGCKTCDEWIRNCAPRSYRLCYMVKAQYKALQGAFTLEEMKKIPPETARWASKPKNLSPGALTKPEVKSALMQPRKKAVAELKQVVPEEHVEDTENMLLKFSESQYAAVVDAYGAFKFYKDENASFEDFVEFCVTEWMDSRDEDHRSFRQAWEARGDKTKKETGAEVAPL